MLALLPSYNLLFAYYYEDTLLVNLNKITIIEKLNLLVVGNKSVIIM